MNKNVFLAVILSIAIYFFWMKVMQKKYPQHYEQKSKSTALAEKSRKTGKEEFDVKKINTENYINVEKTSPKEYKPIEFSFQNFKALFDPNGAGISSYKFKGPVETTELIPSPTPGFFTTMGNLRFELKKKTKNSISFLATAAKGIFVEKIYEWNKNGLNKLTIKISNQTKNISQFPKWDLTIGPGMATVENQIKENKKLQKSVFVVKEKGRKKPTLKNLRKTSAPSDWIWAGVANRYFLACILGSENYDFNIEYKEMEIEENISAPATLFVHPPVILKPNSERKWEIPFYFGPKDYRKLEEIGYGLSRSVEFGFFSQLGKIAMKILYFNYKLTKNYGWSIIILTVMVQFLMFPLTYKSSKSMMVMKKLQPEMKLIQQKYKQDPKRLQQETMALYKKHGANPFGGCLPMLIQIPIFFALFTALRNSWDLHGMGWIFWIHDLSAKDPYYVLPIVMGAMMFLQQKMTMAVADKSQAAIFKFMPIIFTFMFLRFPSGLVLYWLTSNVISFIQQLYLRKATAQNK